MYQFIMGGRDGRGRSICAWKLYILQGDKCEGFGKNAPVYHVYPVSRTSSEERAECLRVVGSKRVITALCRIDVGVCYTRGARSM